MATRLLLRVALAAVGVAGAAVSYAIYDSQRELHQAYNAFVGTQDFRGTLRELRASDSALNPSGDRDFGIAVSLLHSGRPAAAERVSADVARERPFDARPWGTLAQIQVARGRLDAARASWAHTRRLNPSLPVKLPPPL